MKEQIILEILHLLPHYTSDQLCEIKEAVRIVLCRYDISAKSTALQPVDNSSLRYLYLYLETCEQAGKSRVPSLSIIFIFPTFCLMQIKISPRSLTMMSIHTFIIAAISEL
jgi:hypothetical protein